MKYVTCVYEDVLTFFVMKKLIVNFVGKIEITKSINAHGFGAIKRDILKYNQAAKINPFFIITDLDQKKCPVELIKEWFKDNTVSENMIFRIAVHEIDSWILADKIGIANCLDVSEVLIPQNPDEISDPKQFLMNLAKKSKNSDIKNNFPPKDNFAKQGPLYNPILCSFVENEWNVEEAVKKSESLKRAVVALEGFSKK